MHYTYYLLTQKCISMIPFYPYNADVWGLDITSAIIDEIIQEKYK